MLAGFGAAGLVAALLVPITRFTPLVRMIAEWLEIAAIIAALPLAALDRRAVQLGAHAMTRAQAPRRISALIACRPAGRPALHSSCGTGNSAAGSRPGPGAGGWQARRRSSRCGRANICARTITVADPNVAVTAPGFTMLNISKAWQYSTGNGVPVAVIDTGVNPSHRLPVVPGGDYIMGGDGLMDCDSHGTVVASLIAAAPQGIPMPAPMPLAPAFPPPAGPPPADRGAATAGRTAAADRTTPAAFPGDGHRNQAASTATASSAAPARRTVERAGRPGAGRAGRSRGAAAPAGRARRCRRGGAERTDHLDPPVVAGLRIGEARRRRHGSPQEGRHRRHPGQRDRACGEHGRQGDQYQRHRLLCRQQIRWTRAQLAPPSGTRRP